MEDGKDTIESAVAACVSDAYREFVPVRFPFSGVRFVNCLHPFVIHGNVCRCGKCILCRVSQRSEWSLRLDLEAIATEEEKRDCSMVTLTYSPEFLPNELVKRDIQLFLKRFRKELDYPVRYFLSGEYGDNNTRRPHWHIIFYGFRLSDAQLVKDAWKQCDRYDFKLLCSNRTKYVAGYVQKKMDFFMEKASFPDDFFSWSWNDRAAWAVENDVDVLKVRQRPFAMMSRMPGIAYPWYARHKDELFGKFDICVQGKRHPVPRFFREKLKDDFPDWILDFQDMLENKLTADFDEFKARYGSDSVLDFMDWHDSVVRQRATELKKQNELYLARKKMRSNCI